MNVQNKGMWNLAEFAWLANMNNYQNFNSCFNNETITLMMVNHKVTVSSGESSGNELQKKCKKMTYSI